MAWTEPVFDRTESDIQNHTAKGYLNASDLTRVDGNCEALGSMLGISVTTGADWTTGSFPTESQLARIADNTAALRVMAYTDTPEPPAPPLNTWQKWNDIERILFDVHDIYTKNKAARNFAGEIYAGEGIGVI